MGDGEHRGLTLRQENLFCNLLKRKVLKMIIEKNIPMPKQTKKYPFDKMVVGDSIFVDEETSFGAAASSARLYGHGNGMKFVTRKEGSGVRIWRTA